MRENADTFSRVLSAIAIVVAISSFAWTVVRDLRSEDRDLRSAELDRAKLHAGATVIYDLKHQPTLVEIRIVNEGRRPVVLAGVVLKYSEQLFTFSPLPNRNLRLGEGESHLFTVDSNDKTIGISNQRPVDAEIEDTRGRRYKVDGASNAFATLWAARRP